ncbi:MAG TPA: hypothetical protein VGP25_22200 [Gemmatimonadaceae bacterium]|nr:hypothetical protein [Gemmatimonadaceae bacterium]
MNIERAATAEPPKRVAVIAVHGVGSPPAGQTARSVTELLMQGANSAPRYHWFEERTLIIPTAPLDAGPHVKDTSSFFEQAMQSFVNANTDSAKDRTNFLRSPDPASIEEAALRPDIAFTRGLLRAYESKGAPYQTIETVGIRHDTAGDTEVHVFEMHWADLSRIGTGFLRFFGAAYQLVQHVSHLGRKMVDVAAQVAKARTMLADPDALGAPDVGPRTQWARYSSAHAWVIRAYTVLVPVNLLLMMSFIPLFIPAAISAGNQLLVGVIACAVLAIALGGIAIYFLPEDRRAATRFVAYMGAVTIAAAAVLLTHRPFDQHRFLGSVLLTTAVALLTLLALFGALAAYSRTRSGALVYGLIAGLGLLQNTRGIAATLLPGIPLEPAERVRQFAFIGLQIGYFWLMATWLLLWAVVFVTIVLRWDLVRRTTELARLRVTRTAFTARVTLAISAFSFIVAALVFFRSLIFLATRGAKTFDIFPRPLPTGELPTVHIPGLMPTNYHCAVRAAEPCAGEFFKLLIASGGTSGFVIAVFGLAFVLVLISWFIALVVATSVRQPDPEAGNGRRLGLWMSDGFRWLRIAGNALGATLLVAIIVGVVLDVSPTVHDAVRHRAWPWLAALMDKRWTLSVIDTLTVAVLASAATIGTARIRIAALAEKARPALGIILDVDHYLRETPHEATPRARMFERYVSLLRHIHRSGHFDRVVIVSHSQGTIMSTDLLRFLNLGVAGADHDLVSADRFRLLTMGSPLRQMYGVNFPYLYAWVNDSDEPAAEQDQTPIVVPAAASRPDLSERTPDPARLRVARWVNLYTSGDYVGRNLWTPDDWDEVWDRRSAADALTGDGRRERCLGAGTHTHYWTDPEVAVELDGLIAG